MKTLKEIESPINAFEFNKRKELELDYTKEKYIDFKSRKHHADAAVRLRLIFDELEKIKIELESVGLLADFKTLLNELDTAVKRVEQRQSQNESINRD